MAASLSATADVTANKSTADSSFQKTPTTRPATTMRDDNSWLAEIRTAMQEAGIAFCLQHYNEARKKYSRCVQMLLDSDKMSAPTSVESKRTAMHQEQQAKSRYKISSDVLPAKEAAGTVLNTEHYNEVEEKYYHSLQMVSEIMPPPTHGHRDNGMPRICLFMPLLCYACGVVYLKSAAALQDLQAAIHYFNSIHNGDYQSLWFPLACYGLGNTALSQYRYNSAREHFKRGLQALSAPVSSFLASLYWPGTCTPLEEFHDAEKAFRKALTCTLFPAPPDGRCIYSLCLSNGNEQRAIYKSSLGFKGCTTLTCIDGCRMIYHSECWKSFKLQKWMKLAEKEILGQRCFTPDCEGTIFSITSIIIKNDKQMLSEIFVPPAARRKLKSGGGNAHQVAPDNGGSSTGRPQARPRKNLSALPSKAHATRVAAMPGATKTPAEAAMPGATETPAEVVTPGAAGTAVEATKPGATVTPAEAATLGVTVTQEEAASPAKGGEATNLLMSNDMLEWQKSHTRSSISQVAGEHQTAKPHNSHAEHGKALKKSKCRNFDLSTPTVVSESIRNDHQLRCSIQQAVIEGGSALIGQNYSAAETQYETCLKLMALLEPVPETIYDSVSKQEMETRLLYYAAGFACLQQNTKQGVMKGIDHFGAIVNTSSTVWPISYYGRGQGFMLLGSYRHATSDFTKGLTMLSKCFERTLYWPGTTVTIPESCNLKDKFEMALIASRNPPMPVARCVFERCPISNFSEREIYDFSCQYEGFVSIVCSNKCTINYHKNCWKDATLLFWGKSTDKGVPGKPCVTPNCNGRLTRVTVRKHIDGEDRAREKIYHTTITAQNQERNTLPVASIRQPRLLAAASPPLAGHLLKKATTQQRQCHDDSHGALLESVTIKGDVTLSSPVETKKQSAGQSQGETFLGEKVARPGSQASNPLYSVGDVPLLIIKMEKNHQENDLKPERKSNSKVRSVTNDVLRSHIIARPFENSDEQTAQGEHVNMRNYARGADANAAENARENVAVHAEALTAQVPRKEICERIVRFFEEYLKENSPLDVQDTAITEFLVSNCPPQALDIVSACGGIGDFLTQYEQFSLVERYLCLRTKPDSIVPSAKTSDIVPAAVETNYAALKGNHSPQQEFPAITSESNIAANPMFLTNLHETVSDDRSETDTCGNSRHSEVPMSLSARDDSVEIDIPNSVHSKTTLNEKITLLDSQQQVMAMRKPCHGLEDGHRSTSNLCSPEQCNHSWNDKMLQYQATKNLTGTEQHSCSRSSDAQVQVDGLREECFILEQTLAAKVTETMGLAVERDSLLEQLKCQQSQMMSQIQSLQRQVSQLICEVAQAKRESELDRTTLSNLGSCMMELLRVNIGYQEQDLGQRKLTSAQLKEIESGVAKTMTNLQCLQVSHAKSEQDFSL